jgi:hypothetical protein
LNMFYEYFMNNIFKKFINIYFNCFPLYINILLVFNVKI